MKTLSSCEVVTTMPVDDATPGWDAINGALGSLYADQQARHFGAALAWTLGGKDPLDGISVYWSEAGRPHWHYVSYGLSELFDKQSEDPDVSGFGFELTFRLAAPAGAGPADPPPTWPMNLLQNLARYVFQTGNTFEAGHHLDAHGPIAADRATLLHHVAFIEDPQLPARDTVNGRLAFLQVVGLTADEVEAMRRWNSEAMLHAMAAAMPLWITDIARSSLLDDPALSAVAAQGSEQHGSSTGLLLLETLDWRVDGDTTTLVLGVGQVASVRELLGLRLGHGRPLVLASGARQWEFLPGAQEALEPGDDSARCTLDAAGLRALLACLEQPCGRYPVPGTHMVLEIVPTLLRDAQGRVVREIG
ncbi:suppressor of fused domain protein [Stenotrophomonas sp. CFBP 13718]|uniref:suppressor of fused domain protein n=1 Tax=Stenotrophomonas sp. CFBP 13718 TaxID=2775304 RepID=UPI00313A04E0